MRNIPTLITHIHSHIREALSTRRGSFIKNDNAPTGTHKEYQRMTRILLPKAENLLMSLDQILKLRVSSSACTTDRTFSLIELGTLLGNSLGMRDETHRRYPSGGALYPVETYLVGKILEDYPSGVFHYNPKAHALEFLWETPVSFVMSDIIRSPDTALAPCLIIFTSVWSRSSSKYGDLAYSHGLLEAGHMAQNVLLVSTALSMGSRPIAGYHDGTITELLDLDDQVEQPVYSVLLHPSLENL
jgi:SagB-type dehydrogenase family enzyme